MATPILKVDDRGRVTLGAQLSKVGLELQPYYSVTIHTNGDILFRPVNLEGSAA